ncbi:DUF1932 domain-containing protein [Phyllobacterium sp. NPDC097923]|uniref:NAD(P)-dependent oxidoreductase n=1 Tax=Phyllobacterium sp. NPDC097923 TaxID=3364404 RepID=UPI00383B3C1E
MPTTIAIIGAGAMGSAVGQRLIQGGARVLSFTEGRSQRTLDRVRAAGIEPAAIADIARADLIFSIVPPAEAVGVAHGFATVLSAAGAKGTFIDFNAINPLSMREVASVLSGTGWDILDGAIIGLPPKPDNAGPKFYVSGGDEGIVNRLKALGLRTHRVDGSIGAASALKMVYAGINKGLVGLGTTMLLAAAGSGSAASLHAEMAESMPELLARFQRSIPDMYPKAYRWVAEMEEIAEFLGPDDPGAALFHAMAEVFTRMAGDQNGDGRLASTLDGVLAGK